MDVDLVVPITQFKAEMDETEMRAWWEGSLLETQEGWQAYGMIGCLVPHLGVAAAGSPLP